MGGEGGQCPNEDSNLQPLNPELNHSGPMPSHLQTENLFPRLNPAGYAFPSHTLSDDVYEMGFDMKQRIWFLMLFCLLSANR